MSFTNAGTINVSSGDTVNVTATSFNNSGALIVNGGTLDVTEAVTGSGSATISGDGKLEVQGADAQTVTFSGTGGALELASPTSFTGEIAGVTGTGDILDLKGYDASTTASTAGGYNSTTNTTTLTVTDPGHTTLNFTLAGNLAASAWTVTPDSNNAGVDIVDPPAASPSILAISGLLQHWHRLLVIGLTCPATRKSCSGNAESSPRAQGDTEGPTTQLSAPDSVTASKHQGETTSAGDRTTIFSPERA